MSERREFTFNFILKPGVDSDNLSEKLSSEFSKKGKVGHNYPVGNRFEISNPYNIDIPKRMLETAVQVDYEGSLFYCSINKEFSLFRIFVYNSSLTDRGNPANLEKGWTALIRNLEFFVDFIGSDLLLAYGDNEGKVIFSVLDNGYLYSTKVGFLFSTNELSK